MTDEELIARLRELGDHASFEPHMHHTAADRIEDLVERNKELALQLLATQGQAAEAAEALIAERDDALGEWDKAIVLADKAAALMNEMDTRRIAAEAKLAKAVEALKMMCEEFRGYDLPYGSKAYSQATATLAEIKGESHE